jgi:hypothetical protein
MPAKELTKSAQSVFSSGGVFVPSPLALNENKQHDEAYQRLLTLYYIRSGAKAVIPGAHTGEFALNDLDLLDRWMLWIKEMTGQYGDGMVLMAMIGGNDAIKQAELAIQHGYDAVMIAPTAFSGKSEDGVIELFEKVSSGIPTFAFELQRAIPGSYEYTPELWSRIFNFVYGAKGASFDTYRSLVMLEAAALSQRKEELVLFTGNDDRIVADLLGDYSYHTEYGTSTVNYRGGLLGHFATDTQAAVSWFEAIQEKKRTGTWNFELSEEELSHGVNRCNMALFDALGNFENSVWGVKYRLSSMGLLPGPYCMHETGRKDQDKAIDMVYNEYEALNDHQFILDNLKHFKREIGIKS